MSKSNGRTNKSWKFRYKDYRCRHCSRLLWKGRIISNPDCVEVRCPRCNHISTWRGDDLPSEPSKIEQPAASIAT